MYLQKRMVQAAALVLGLCLVPYANDEGEIMQTLDEAKLELDE